MSEILVFPQSEFPERPRQGVWPIGGWPAQWRWMARDRAENDACWLQPIPYALLRNPEGKLWCYRRSGGDQRLRERRSCGLGGHVDRGDGRGGLGAAITAALRRELNEELANAGALAIPKPLAWLYEGDSAVGRVHIGLIHLLDWPGPEAPAVTPGEALEPVGFVDPRCIAADHRYELWSRLAVDFLLDAIQ